MCLKQKKYVNHAVIFVLLAGISVTVSLFFPVYFRNDDGTNIYWAATHKFIEVFSLKEVTFLGTLRPAFFAFWWFIFGFRRTHSFLVFRKMAAISKFLEI